MGSRAILFHAVTGSTWVKPRPHTWVKPKPHTNQAAHGWTDASSLGIGVFVWWGVLAFLFVVRVFVCV